MSLDNFDRDLNEQLLDTINNVLPELLKAKDKIDIAIQELKFYKSQKTVNNDRSTARIIMRGVLDHFTINQIELKGRRRDGDIRMARQIFCALTRNYTGLSTTVIGTFVNRDHATVIHACKIVQNACDTSASMWDHYKLVEERVTKVLTSGVEPSRQYKQPKRTVSDQPI